MVDQGRSRSLERRRGQGFAWKVKRIAGRACGWRRFGAHFKWQLPIFEKLRIDLFFRAVSNKRYFRLYAMVTKCLQLHAGEKKKKILLGITFFFWHILCRHIFGSLDTARRMKIFLFYMTKKEERLTWCYGADSSFTESRKWKMSDESGRPTEKPCYQ